MKSAQRAEDVLLRMSASASSSSSSSSSRPVDDDADAVRVDVRSFNTVLKAWGNSGGGMNAARRADLVLRKMMKLCDDGHDDIRPDAISYTTVMGAYLRVDHDDHAKALDRVMKLLDEFEGRSSSSSSCGIETDVVSCYNAAANVVVGGGGAVDAVHDDVRRTRIMRRDAAKAKAGAELEDGFSPAHLGMVTQIVRETRRRLP